MPLTRRLCLAHPLVLVPLGVLAWYATYRSGVHATIAGVALGLLTPVEVIPRLEAGCTAGRATWCCRVSLFVAGLAYEGSPELEEAAKIGILGGSVVAAALGPLLLALATRRPVSR